MSKPVEHYLISINLHPVPACMHTYLMTNDPERTIQGVCNKMMEFIETTFTEPPKPVVIGILCTKLDTYTDTLRQKLCERSEESARTMAAATTFHVTMWELETNDPWNIELMKTVH